MPEGDTILRAAETLQRALGGTVVTRFESVYPALNRIDEDAPIAGRTVESVHAAGKHLLMHFSGDLVLRTHMRMSGSWHIYRPGEPWQLPRSGMRIVVATAGFVAVAFHVTDAEFLHGPAVARQRTLRALGPDLLAESFAIDTAVARLRERGTETIEAALLDQRAVAGIGNVYKSEVLFACRIHPFTPVAALDDAALTRIVSTARRLMQANAGITPIVGLATPAGRQTTGRMDPSQRLWVYGRAGKPCRRCGTPIERAKSGPDIRSTYWCPGCQRLPP